MPHCASLLSCPGLTDFVGVDLFLGSVLFHSSACLFLPLPLPALLLLVTVPMFSCWVMVAFQRNLEPGSVLAEALGFYSRSLWLRERFGGTT